MGLAAAVIAGVSVVGTGTKAYGLYQQNKAENAARDYNAGVADRNASYATEQAGYLMEQAVYLEGEAKDVLHQGVLEEKSFRRSLNAFVGEQRSSYGAAGVVVSEGSASKVVNESNKQGELDAMTIKYNYAKQAEGIEREALQTKRSAKRYKDMADDYKKNAAFLRAGKTSSVLPITSALLDGTSSLASIKYS